MPTDTNLALTKLFSELIEGPQQKGEAFALNSGDIGLLRSLDKLSAAQASRSANGGATIAAHTQHVRYGLSLMNQWAIDGSDAFSNPKWDEAWKLTVVDAAQWDEIRSGLRHESERWLATLGSKSRVTVAELCGMLGSIVHLAYHLGAIRQIDKTARGPKEGSFTTSPR